MGPSMEILTRLSIKGLGLHSISKVGFRVAHSGEGTFTIGGDTGRTKVQAISFALLGNASAKCWFELENSSSLNKVLKLLKKPVGPAFSCLAKNTMRTAKTADRFQIRVIKPLSQIILSKSYTRKMSQITS